MQVAQALPEFLRNDMWLFLGADKISRSSDYGENKEDTYWDPSIPH